MTSKEGRSRKKIPKGIANSSILLFNSIFWGIVVVLFSIFCLGVSLIFLLLYRKAKQEIEELQKEKLGLTVEVARLQEKLTLHSITHSQLEEKFEQLAGKVLSNNQQQFFALADYSFQQHQLRLKEQEGGVRQALEQISNRTKELELARERAFAGLHQQLSSLANQNGLLQKETTALAQALKNSSMRGRWGELQLRRALEMTGMVAYCDFSEQVSLVDGDQGGVLRPDVIVNLPNNRVVVIDSKVPLQEFMQAAEGLSEEEKKRALIGHAKQVRTHIERLSQKKYWQQFSNSAEFVVLFLPGESFFGAALEHDPSLLEYGIERNIILATPSTLLALLRAIAHGWKQDELSQNAFKILEEAKELYQRLAVFTDHFKEIRVGLDRAGKAYNSALASFETRLLVSARRLQELRVGSGKEIQSPKAIDPVEVTFEKH